LESGRNEWPDVVEMFQNEAQPPTVREVIFKQASPILRRMFLLYLVNAVLLIVFAGAFSVLFPSFGGGPWTLGLEAYAVLIAVYAGIVYLLGRSAMSVGLGRHCYALAVLGFGFGGFLDAWGGYGFLSLGYWLGQAGKESPSVCGRDGGEVVVFGPESLACPKCSRVVRVGYDIPRGWAKAGLAVFLLGVLIYVMNSSLGMFNTFYARYVGDVLLFTGLAFALTFYLQRMYFGGLVRIPSINQSGVREEGEVSGR